MSRRYESDCVGCDLPCIGLSCRYYRVAVDSCDVCGNDDAKYNVDGTDYCEECLEQMINEEWEDLDLEQKAEYLDIGISDIDYDIED